MRNFQRLGELAERWQQGASPAELKDTARRLVAFFDDVVREHHQEEEQELFRAVLDSLEGEPEADRAREQITRLSREHRELETLWAEIEPALKRLARGKPAQLDTDKARELAERYLAHARFEEEEFLPLSARILDKNAMSALGLSLHMRHQGRVNPYI